MIRKSAFLLLMFCLFFGGESHAEDSLDKCMNGMVFMTEGEPKNRQHVVPDKAQLGSVVSACEKSLGNNLDEDVRNLVLLKISYLNFEKNSAESKIEIERLAKNGNPHALIILSFIKESILKEKDYFQYLEKAAEIGNSYAQLGTALGYLRGDGVSKDITKSIFWLKKAEQQDEPQAALLLGHAYRAGVHVPGNIDLAKKYYEKAYELGIEDAEILILQIESQKHFENKKR